MKKRFGLIYFGCLLTLGALLFRLFYLATGSNAKRAVNALGSREKEVVLYHTKGLIYDENLIPLAGGQICKYVIVDPREFSRSNLGELLAATDGDFASVSKKLEKETPFILTLRDEIFDMPGVSVVEGKSRYSGLAQHLLGYLDSAGEAGVAGIEREYDAVLNLYRSRVYFRYQKDALNGVLAGKEIFIDQGTETKNGIVLTLNAEMCRALENEMDKNIEIGAAVVMDSENGEIKAMVSRPGYDEKKIASYLESQNGELINRALSAKTVGSVFKMVVAACALERELEDFSYNCEGGVVIGDHNFSCHSENGHGEVGLKEAFSESCNSYFIAVGQLLGAECICEMASRFGFGESIAVTEEIRTAAGRLPTYSDRMSLANLSIGQGELTAAPLQIARMTAVIANGGKLLSPRVYKGIYANGILNPKEEIFDEKRIISEEHALKLRELCISVVEEGTGAAAKPDVGGAGGKTASGQTGIYSDGKESLDVYFTGFYPAVKPRYVITVFAENGASGGKTCAPLFREICNFIAENGLTQ